MIHYNISRHKKREALRQLAEDLPFAETVSVAPLISFLILSYLRSYTGNTPFDSSILLFEAMACY